MNLPVANQPVPSEKPAASKRFEFATGDRPLSGYTIKRGVGRGGFGEVYFALSDGGKEVALKLIRRNLDVELRGVQHCLNLKHPNLIALYDVRRDGDDGDCWIVMEYVAGESLESAIARQPQGMPVEEALDWLRGIAAGAAYLHSHGIVHRDLKPGNVFRDESVVKLGDYGLSKFISCSRRSGQTESVGTVHYMAPEVAHGRYGREIDIYALGVILYEMLTGRVPFDGESVGEVLMKHLTAQPDINAVPPAFRHVVARALAKDPAARFSSIEQLLAALPGAAGRSSGESPIDAIPVPPAASATARVQSPPPEPVRVASNHKPADRSPWEALDSFSPARLIRTVDSAITTEVLEALDSFSPAGLAVIAGLLTFVLAPGLSLTLVGRGRLGILFLVMLPTVAAAFAYSYAKNRASLRAASRRQPTSDAPRPLPSAAASPPQSNGAARPAFDSVPPSAALWALIGVMVALAAVPGTLSFVAGGGQPASLFLLAIAVVGGVAGYSLAKQRAKWKAAQAASLRNWSPTSDEPPPLPASARRMNSAPAKSRSEFEKAAYDLGRAVGWRSDRSTPALVLKSARERAIELLESLLVSAAVAVVLAVIATAWLREDSGIGEGTWFTLTGTLGAWGVLLLSKFWEGTRGEQILRRFAMLVVGLGVGAGSFALDRLLMVNLPFEQLIRPAAWHVDWSFYNNLNGSPRLAAYLAYFGPMFFLIPWWRGADPLRRSRVRIGSLVWTLSVALGLNLFCPFPQPFGAVVALIISLCVQLASPTVKAGQPTPSR